jgi:hypothetical protein
LEVTYHNPLLRRRCNWLIVLWTSYQIWQEKLHSWSKSFADYWMWPNFDRSHWGHCSRQILLGSRCWILYSLRSQLHQWVDPYWAERAIWICHSGSHHIWPLACLPSWIASPRWQDPLWVRLYWRWLLENYLRCPNCPCCSLKQSLINCLQLWDSEVFEAE